MKISYILLLAYKNLKGHKLRTFLTAGGVAISVGFVIFLISLGMGLQRISTKQISNLDALQVLDVTIAKSRIINLNDNTIEKFGTLSNVIEAHPFINVAAKISYKSSEIDAVAYGKNVDFIEHEDLKIESGKKYTKIDREVAMISKSAKDALGGEDPIGKEITVSAMIKNDLLEKGSKSKILEKKLIVTGVIDDKNASYVYLPLDLFVEDKVVNYSGAKIKVNSKEAVDKTKAEVENLGFKVSTIKETVDQINQFFSIFQVILISFGIIAIIVACLGMFNTLTISLLEKTREVGFMKALGTRKKDIYRLFIIESLLIGAIGAIAGILAGYATGQALNGMIIGLAKATGNKPFELFYAPFYVFPFVVLVSLLVSFFTGLYPASRAAKIRALDALRYE